MSLFEREIEKIQKKRFDIFELDVAGFVTKLHLEKELPINKRLMRCSSLTQPCTCTWVLIQKSQIKKRLKRNQE